MMYRLLKALTDWKFSFYRKCNILLAVLSLVALLDCVYSTTSGSNLKKSVSGRALFEHGIFRHDDKPSWDTVAPYPPRSDISGSTKDVIQQPTCQNPHGCQTDSIVSVPPADNKDRDRYAYDRFKRSVTTLNFHPKARNVSKNVGLKPLRIFKYVTEDDVLKPSNYERRVTIFHPIESGGGVKKASNDTNHQQIIGGAKVNLKAKLDKGGSNIRNNSSNQVISNEANSESKSHRNNIASLKPENVKVYKPSLAIRKNTNKTSLIPSGNHAHIKYNGGATVRRNSFTTTHEESSSSPDPNSSTVNDRSLIQSLYFDSVVMLNKEGQKQLLDQQHQSVESHREKTSSNRGASDDEIISMSATPPSSSISASDESNSNATIGKKNLIIKPSLPITNKGNYSKANANITTSIASGLVEHLIDAINATIRENKDNVIFTVKTKGKKSSNKKSKKTKHLDEDDIGHDGSERSRRSPFKPPNKFQPPIQRRTAPLQSPNNGGQLARAALFRRTTASRYRPTTKVFLPRPMSPQNHHHGKIPMGRTILPMRHMPMGSKPPQKFAMVSGPLGPGPVGPPIAAIKVTNFNALNNNKNNNNNKNMMMQPPPGAKEITPDASRTIYNYKPLPSDVLLHQESSYYSPTYKRFKNRFEDQILSMIESQKGLDEPMSRWDTDASRFQSRPMSHTKLRSRSSADRDRQRNHRHHQERRERERERRERERERERHDRDRERHSDRHQDRHRSGHGHPRQSHRGKKISINPKYTYPKNAENIQDILRHFDKGQDYGPPMSMSKDSMDKSEPMEHAKKQGSSIPDIPNHPKLADLSGEFKDVHASLLKDIKEFARRPNLFRPGSSGHSSDRKLHSYSQSHHPFDSNEAGSGGGFDDPIDEIFGNHKSQPTHDGIKPDLYSLENIRERIAFKRGKLHGKFRDKDHHKNKNSHSGEKDIHTDVIHHDEDDEFYDSHRPSRHNGEDGHSTEHVKSSLASIFSKEVYDSPASHSKRNKYKDSHQNHNDHNDDSLTIFPSSHYHRDKEHKDTDKEQSSPFEFNSAEFRKNMKYPINKPIVLKRPNEPFRIREPESFRVKEPEPFRIRETEPFRVRETEPKKKPEHDYYWNTYSNGFEKQSSPITYDAPLVLKSPAPPVMQSYNPFAHNPFGNPAISHPHQLQKPLSLEEEDIVEIHTGGPGGSASGHPSFPPPDTHVAKQDKLQKMYMDVLQQKMQLEAALYRPQAPSIPPPPIAPRPQPQISHMPAQMSQMLQMSNPVHMQRMPQQMSGYHTSPVTLSPLPGIPGLRKKKPMRMKIHIYPNGNDGLEQGIEAANLLAGQFGTSGFSASNPPGVVAAPPKGLPAKSSESAMPSGPSSMQSSPTGFGRGSGPGPMGPGPGKKNVVLHLHVHRRNDVLSPLEVEAEGSNTHPVTVKPLSYKEIFDEQMQSEREEQRQHNSNSHHRNHNHREEEPLSTQDTRETEAHGDDDDETERDKSVSMEVPIHDEKVEDVLHSLMKHRNNNNKPDSRKRRS